MLDKVYHLKAELSKFSSVLIAFSGGTDSTFLLKVCTEIFGSRCVAVTVDAEIIHRREVSNAKETSRSLGSNHVVIPQNVLSKPEIASNPPERCYYCKKVIFNNLLNIAEKYNCDAVLDGTNVDDFSDYRPGIKALSELGIVSPLKDAGLSKQEIRHVSAHHGLSNWNMPSNSCLATRFPYGDWITSEKLRQVEEAEDILLSLGFEQLRVRHHGTIARIEVPEDCFDRFLREPLRNKVVNDIKSLGFSFITLDLRGFRSGSMNEVLYNREEQR